jgi:RluA family pseudouridine synthase
MRPVRLDQAVAARFPGVSRRKARELLAQHRVLVNDRPVSVASRLVTADDRLTIVDELPRVDVIRMTDAWIAINKAAGVPSQPVRGRDRRSVEELLQVQLKREGLPADLFVVHRIDEPTSGVLLFARTRAEAGHLSEVFASGAMSKQYVAVVNGRLAGALSVDTAIERTATNRFDVGQAGKAAQTIVRPIATSDQATLVEVEITTGRTHQIRVHLSSIGHGILGDRKYGSSGSGASRLMLHARMLEHASIGQVSADLPEDFRKVCEQLGLSCQL